MQPNTGGPCRRETIHRLADIEPNPVSHRYPCTWLEEACPGMTGRLKMYRESFLTIVPLPQYAQAPNLGFPG